MNDARFTAGARLLVKVAEREAAGAGRTLVSTDDLLSGLLALLREDDGVERSAPRPALLDELRRLGVDLDALARESRPRTRGDRTDLHSPLVGLSEESRIALEQAAAQGDGQVSEASLLCVLVSNPSPFLLQFLEKVKLSRATLMEAAQRALPTQDVKGRTVRNQSQVKPPNLVPSKRR